MTKQGGWPPSGFGERLKLMREQAGMSQGLLAERAGCHLLTVSKIERGLHEPAWPLVQALARALDVTSAAFDVPAGEATAPPGAQPRKDETCGQADAQLKARTPFPRRFVNMAKQKSINQIVNMAKQQGINLEKEVEDVLHGGPGFRPQEVDKQQKYGKPFMTAYQILHRLPAGTRTFLLSLPGMSQPYSAVSVVERIIRKLCKRLPIDLDWLYTGAKRAKFKMGGKWYLVHGHVLQLYRIR